MPSRKNLNPSSGIMKTLSNQPSTTGWHLGHFPTTFWTASSSTSPPSPRGKTSCHSSLLPQIYSKLKSLISTHRQPTNSPSFSTFRWWQTPTSSTCMSSCHCQSTLILRPTFQSLRTWDKQIFSQLDTHNLFKQFPALICTLVFTSETPSFAKGGK